MTDKAKSEPIEGFHVTGYDPATETLTISVHKMLFKHQPSSNAMADKAVEIIGAGPSVKRVVFVPRDE